MNIGIARLGGMGRGILACAFTLIFVCVGDGYAGEMREQDNWTRSGGSHLSDKYSSLSQINKANVAKIRVAWIHKSGWALNGQDTVQTNPILAGDTLITTNLDGKLIGINPENGREKWRLGLPGPVGRRGITAHEGRVFVPTSAGIHVVNIQSGKLDLSLGDKGRFGDGVSYLPPIVTSHMVISGDFSGVVEAWDRSTGKSLWRTSLAKDNVYPRLWSGISYDEASQLVFVVTSNAGGLLGEGIRDGGYSCSLLAISAKNGAIVWQFQEIKHDIWDLDVVGAPIITTINVEGKLIPVVAAVTKSGNTLLVERFSGKPVFGVGSQKALKSDIPNELTAPEQIKIELPQPFSDNLFDFKRDVTTLSDRQRSYVLHKLRHAQSGNFMPISLAHDVVFFGLHGGAEWPGAALDQRSGVMVVPSNRQPWIIRAGYFDKNASKTEVIAKSHSLYMNKCAYCHGANLAGTYLHEFDGDGYYPSLVGITKTRGRKYLTSANVFRAEHKYFPLLSAETQRAGIPAIRAKLDTISEAELRELYGLFSKVDRDIAKRNDFGIIGFWQLLLDSDGMPGSNPPWGYLTAIDLNSGKIKWRTPFGIAHNAVSGKDYAGDINFGGVMVSRGGLVFANGTRDAMARAFDLDTGKELWQSKLPAVGSAPPMTYEYKGCQYVIFTATGGRFVGFGKPSDTTVAYKLPNCK